MSYTLTEPDALTSTSVVGTTISGYNISCSDATDGKIIYSLNGGVAPYSISWSGPNGFTSSASSLSGLAAGSYSVHSTDANGCEIMDTIHLIAPDPLSISLTGPPLSNNHHIPCAGDLSGTIQTTISGGTPFFQYDWSGPHGFAAATENLTDIGAGSYLLVVTDTNGCKANASITLSEPDSIRITSTVSDFNGFAVSCSGNDGAIDISTTGGAGALNYYWIASNASTYTTEDISGLDSGTYTLNISDGNNCTHSAVFTLDQAPFAQVSVQMSDYNGVAVSCSGAADGSLSTTLSNINGSASVSWNGPNGFSASTASISGLEAGQYQLTVTDNSNCAIDSLFELSEAQPITTALSAPATGGYHIPCTGDSTGSIYLIASGGTGPMTTIWSGPNGFSSTATSLSNLEAGIYMVSSTDVNGCTAVDSIALSEPDSSLTLSSTVSNYISGTAVSCADAADGWIDLTILGGTAPHMFNWMLSSGATDTNEDVAGLPAGAHSVTITDALGCQTLDTIILNAPPALQVSSITTSQFGLNQLSCAGSSDGSIDILISGGYGLINTGWTGPNAYTGSGFSLNNLSEGLYTFTANDENGCTIQDSIALNAPVPLNTGIIARLYPGGTAISCSGANDGSLASTPAGGNAPYSISWNGPNGFNASTDSISDLGPGTYCLTVVDGNNCSATDCIDIIEPNQINITTSLTNAGCGQATGAINLSLTGGTAPFSFAWSNGSNLEDLTDLTAGNYTVSVSDVNGCTSIITTTVGGTDAPEVLGSTTNVSCATESNGSIDIVVSNGTPPYAYDWNNGAQSQDISGIGAGTYLVEVTDASGCISTASFIVTEPAPLNIELELSDYTGGYQISGFNTNDGTAEAFVTGGTMPYSFEWSNGATGTFISDLSAGAYALTVTDVHGCQKTISFDMEQPFALEMPTGFSPNGDGFNDYFVIHGISLYPNNELMVFNRWGDVVYSRKGYNDQWGGEGKNGNMLADGTYFAVLRVPGTEIELSGYVELRH
jgi:gliding motility-associated-like protein